MNDTTTIGTSTLLIMCLVIGILVTILVVFLVAQGKRKTTAKLQEVEAELGDTAETNESLKIRLNRALQGKNDAFRERNFLVALMVRTVLDNNLPDWEFWQGHTEEFKGWEGVVYMDHPTIGQISWHFANEDQWMLDSLHLPSGPEWDGRTSAEKYGAIRQYLLDGAKSSVQQ